jgi:hypothetical protein
MWRSIVLVAFGCTLASACGPPPGSVGRDDGCFTDTAGPLIYTNLGPLTDFTPPASCSLLTAEVSYYEGGVYGESASPGQTFYTVTGPDYTFNGIDYGPATSTFYPIAETFVLGAGAAWANMHLPPEINPGLLPDDPEEPFSPTAPIPPSECFPTNFFSDIGALPLQRSSSLVAHYYSPAPACPVGWEVASSTTSTSSKAADTTISFLNGTAFTITIAPPAIATETEGTCCPQGWTLSGWPNGPQDGKCYSGAGDDNQGVYTAASLFNDASLPTLTPGPFRITGVKPSEFGIQIRWQSTDVVVKPSSQSTHAISSTASRTVSGMVTNTKLSSVSGLVTGTVLSSYSSGSSLTDSISSSTNTTGSTVATVSSSKGASCATGLSRLFASILASLSILLALI